MSGSHRSLGLGDIHRIANWEYATAAARTGATGFTADDVGKIAKQTDNNTFWELTAVTPTWLQIGANSIEVEITVNAEVGDEINVDVQIQDSAGNDLTDGYALWMWLSDSATEGTAITATAPDGGIAADDGAIIVEATSGKVWLAAFNSGLFIVTIAETSDPTWYLHVVLPDGSIVVSGAITFAL